MKTATGTVRADAYPYLGIHKNAIALPLGLEDTTCRRPGCRLFDPKSHKISSTCSRGYGRYARDLGINALDLLPVGTSGAGDLILTATKASVSKTGDHRVLPSTEGSARQHGRGVAQAVDVSELNAPAEREEERLPGDASHAFLPGLRSPVAADAQGDLGSPTSADQGKNKGMYDPNDPRGMSKRRWAMTIDLARCTGCSACVTACYSENNIPTVGAYWQNATLFADARPGFNIERGREMNWIRLERYFEGNIDGKFGEDFETLRRPNALSALWQRAVRAGLPGVRDVPRARRTQCPGLQSLRRHALLLQQLSVQGSVLQLVRLRRDRSLAVRAPEPLNWQLNPDVTVRGKGVMEKCTFCVQRIREAENRAALEHRDIEPDEFTVACAQACPSRAIVFGDAAGPPPNWTVAQLAHDRRAYHVFEELNTFTAVVYLKKVNHSASAAAAPRA